VVANCIVFRALEKLIPGEAWYEGGYRANIVTYSIAKLCDMTANAPGGKALDYQAIWRQQGISPALSEQLRIVARAMYAVITAPEGGTENVTEWCKKNLAWDRARQAVVRLLPAFETELVSAEDVKQAIEDAAGDAAIDRGIAAVTRVLATRPSDWKQIRQWGLDRQLLTAKEEQLLLVATNPRRPPSDRQAAAILQIHRKLEREGLSVG
jgi:hypothetical protein